MNAFERKNMGELLGAGIYILIVVIASILGKKKKEEALGKSAPKVKRLSGPMEDKKPEKALEHPVRISANDRRKTSAKELASNLEDRKHDWLAKQLAEERAVEIKGSLTDLGAGHRDDCDALNLKLQYLTK